MDFANARLGFDRSRFTFLHPMLILDVCCSAQELLALRASPAVADGGDGLAEAILYRRSAVAADAANPPTPAPPPPPPNQLPGAPVAPPGTPPPPFTVFSNATRANFRSRADVPGVFPGTMTCSPVGRGDAGLGKAAGGAAQVTKAGYEAQAAGLGAVAAFRLDAPRGDCGAYPLQPNAELLSADNITAAAGSGASASDGGIGGIVTAGKIIRLGCRAGFAPLPAASAAGLLAMCMPTGRFNFTPARYRCTVCGRVIEAL
jgi:hypothetical protein